MKQVNNDACSQTKRINPIIKMINDKKIIAQAIKEGKDLSKLKGIKIVSPL